MPARPVCSAARSLPVDRRKSRCCQRGKVGWWRWNLQTRPASDCAGPKCIGSRKGKSCCAFPCWAILPCCATAPRCSCRRRKRRGRLLAYLAVTARPHRRDRLCAMFWTVPDDPRAALRWSLSRLRPLVDEPDCRRIIADRENVGLDLDRVTVDLLSLRSLARNGTDAISTDALREATEALEGDFLEGLDLPDCHEFQSWCTAEREETRRLRVRLLTALVTRLEDVPDDALRHARALSLLEPANESRPGHVGSIAARHRPLARGRAAVSERRAAARTVQRGAHRRAAAGAQLPLQAEVRTDARRPRTFPALTPSGCARARLA